MTLRDLLRYRWGCSCWLGSSHPVMCWALCTTLPSLFQGGHLPVGHLVAAGEQPHNRSVVRKLHDGVWSLCCHAVVGVEGIPEGAEDTATWHSRADGQPWRGAVATTWRQSVKNSRIQSHIVVLRSAFLSSLMSLEGNLLSITFFLQYTACCDL